MEQLIGILIVGAIALANWLLRKSSEQPPSDQPSPPPFKPIPRSESQSETERTRKFLEALGIPAESLPPVTPSVPRRPAEPPRQTVPRPIRRVPTITPPPTPAPKRFVVVPPAIPAEYLAPEPEPAFIPMPSLPEKTPAVLENTDAFSSSRGSEIRQLFKSKSSIRTAILMREILGQPRGLQSPF